MEALEASLAAMNADTSALKMRILSLAAREAKITEGLQTVFADVYEKAPRSSAVANYANVLCRGLILRQISPMYETVDILEKIYIIDRDPILALALSTFYLSRRHRTAASRGIISDALSWQEEKGILLRVFKDFKDQIGESAYINRSHPFMYIGEPGRSVSLYCESPDAPARRLEMKYLRYGVYLACLTMFYGERVAARIAESEGGSSHEFIEDEKTPYAKDDGGSLYLMVNNAAASLMMLKDAEAEAMAEKALGLIESPKLKLL
jgi:hypothetical protein